MSGLNRFATVLFVLVLGATGLRAQPVAEPAIVRGESPQTRKRLAEAEQKVLGGKAAEAVEDLQRILDEAGDDLISVDGKHHRSARAVAHQILAKLPADVLKTYRDRIEEPARKLLDAGKRDRDPRPLWQLLDRYFVSRPSEDGLLLLGDLLYERGDSRLAEVIWKRLLPDAEADVTYPGAKVPPAAVRARIILAVHSQGESARAKAELDAFEKQHPDAAGPFAGKIGPYAATLRELLTKPLPAGSVADRSWPAFAGDPARTNRLRGPIPIRWPTRPTWSAAIPADGNVLLKPPPAQPPFGHPAIIDGWAYVTDGHRVLGYELATGDQRTIFPQFKVKADQRAADPPSCPSITAAHGRLYARIGSSVIRPPDPLRPPDSAIVCLVPEAKPELRLLWRITPPVAEGRANASWEGAPLVANGRLWAAFSRIEGGRVHFAVACYDPADADTAPERPAWIVEVCESPLLSSPEQQMRARLELLTLAGRNIVFNTNAGAVIALDANTGHRAWTFQYPRAARRLVDANRSPDLAPAIADGGRVFVAPADCERVYGLDAETGRELWESGPVEGAHLLGVVRNRVILTSTGPVKSIRALSVVSGSYRKPHGWIQTTGLLSYCHGLVSDGAILWPSRDGLYFLDPDTGDPIRTAPPLLTMNGEDRGHLFGNLAFADGWLVVVGAAEVRAYRPIGPPFVKPDDVRNGFTSLMDQGRFLDAARGNFPDSLRVVAAARLKDGPAFPELRGEWLLTDDGELVSYGTLLDRRAGKADPERSVPGTPWSPADRKPLDAPSLSADAEVTDTLRLPLNAFPLNPIRGANPPRQVVVEAPGELLAVSIAGGTKTSFAITGTFTHAADLPEGFVIVGPFAVAVYGAGREPVWVFRVPDFHSLPQPKLTSFNLAGEWLFARLGDRHLIALDLKSHVVAWVLGTHGSRGFEPIVFPAVPGFTEQFFVSERLLAVQLTDGRRWFVQSSTGRVWSDRGKTFADAVPADHGVPTAVVPWKSPPVLVEGNLVAYPDGAGLVRFASGTSNKSKFSYQVEGESSLAGESLQVRRIGEMLFVAVRRNYGVELTRLEPLDGKPDWRDPAFLETGSVDLAAADADPQRLFVPTSDSIQAFNLNDGKLAWQAKLPVAGRWTVRAGRKVAIAFPAHAIPEEPLDAAWSRVRGSFLREPRLWRLPWLVSALYDCWTERTLPVIVFDLETGKQLRTMNIPARGPAIVSIFEGDTAVIATSDRIVWLK